MKNVPSYERYSRQIILKGFGMEAQEKLSRASVLVVGAGGLGCPCLQYLTAAGVGRIGILDYDSVTLNNLHRQVLYRMEDIGKSKALTAKKNLEQLNPDVQFEIYNFRLTAKNAAEFISGYDIIIDASDNFDTRYTVNDTCVQLGKTLVYGALSTQEGQVAVFNMPLAGGKRSIHYRDIYPVPPAINEIPNCAEAGVIGVLTGIIGSMMSNETIKIITGYAKPLCNEMLIYDSKSNDIYKLDLASGYKEVDSHAALNSAPSPQKLTTEKESFREIDGDLLSELMSKGKSDLIDIRELEETPDFTAFQCRRVPMKEVIHRLDEWEADNIILICQSGTRSALLARELSNKIADSKKIYSLRGGISKWFSENKI